jgi:hypothetical protein
MNMLTLVQTSPATNPDTNVVKCVVSGAYVNGTADTLPLAAIADPQVLVQVPLNNPGQNPPPVTPAIRNCSAIGFYAVVTRVLANGITTFGLRWFQESTNAELASEAYPAAITGAEIFIDILCPVTQMA